MIASNEGYQWSHKKDLYPSKLKKKNLTLLNQIKHHLILTDGGIKLSHL